jgi:hypothetical protein
MLILLMMLLVGLFAGVWGFLMCFQPARWDRLTEALGGSTPRWMYPGPQRLAPIIKTINRVAGMVICIGGCWFTYIAASMICRFLTRKPVTLPEFFWQVPLPDAAEKSLSIPPATSS